ncbi:hypothetical protein BY458DRAFT_532990 [Sporodiniella umbellata]|nr:hypothetical protein BY458DRAFT_532990 [Sporodiniella umbellata]
MPNYRKNSRGRGRGRGGRGGRGGHRQLYPSSQGFLYRLESNVDVEDDFRLYGQFDNDNDHPTPQSKKKQAMKPKLLHLQPVSFNKSTEVVNKPELAKETTTIEIDFATLEAEGISAIQKAEGAQVATAAIDKTSDESSDFDSEADMERREDRADTEEDEQLEEDMLIMEDYMEHLILESDEELEDLLIDFTEEVYDYSTLDRFQQLTQEIEEEEALMTTDTLHEKIIKNTRKKKPVKNKGTVDPEIFGETLKASMAQVPPSLRPGMRAWYEKQERREEKKKELKKGKAIAKEDSCLEKADRRMRDFIEDESISCFEFAPMTKEVRKHVHTMARIYCLNSKGVGKKDQRHIVLRKTAETCIPKNRRSIDRYIVQMSRHLDEQAALALKHTAPYTKSKKPASKHSKKKEKKAQGTDKPSHGAIVAHHAKPIEDTNVGHRMLAAMGWQQGQALGTNNTGIVAPIEAIIRRDKLGLGL